MPGLPRDDAIRNLKEGWRFLHPLIKGDLIASLLGHHLKLSVVAKSIGRSTGEVRVAWLVHRLRCLVSGLIKKEAEEIWKQTFPSVPFPKPAPKRRPKK